jgi:hypothetical protein
MFMLSKRTYVVQPYQVGSKDKKSLALIIPAKVTRECGINTSTIFAVQVNELSKHITLQIVDLPHQKTPTGRV